MLDATRGAIELYARHMLEVQELARSTVAKRLSTLRVFYRYCADEEIIAKDPSVRVRRPKIPRGESTNLGMTRGEMVAFIDAADRSSPQDHALACLFINNALRVSEVCGTDVTDLGSNRGHRTLHIVGKGDKPATIALAPRTIRAIDIHVGARTEGPIFRRRDGKRLDRDTAARWVRKIAKAAGITHKVSPHSARHAAVTTLLDAGVPIRDVQNFARHDDPATTTIYDRNRRNLDRHATYTLAALLGGGD